MSKRKINKLMILIAFIFILSSCDQSYDYNREDTAKRVVNNNVQSALECSKEKTSMAKAACAEDVLKNVKDKWVRECAIWNIDEKAVLWKSLSEWTINDAWLKDIDWIIKECAYYKKKNEEYVSQHSNSHPIFSSFIGAAMGNFAWNYMYDHMFNNQKKDEQVVSSGITSWTTSSWYVWKSKDTNVKSWNSTTNIEKIDTQHKKDNWNIKEMKSNSAKKTNYKLGNSGKTWSKFQSVSKSRSSSSTTKSRSSWWSSSRSSLG